MIASYHLQDERIRIQRKRQRREVAEVNKVENYRSFKHGRGKCACQRRDSSSVFPCLDWQCAKWVNFAPWFSLLGRERRHENCWKPNSDPLAPRRLFPLVDLSSGRRVAVRWSANTQPATDAPCSPRSNPSPPWRQTETTNICTDNIAWCNK